MARRPVKIDNISLPTFKSILSRYEQHIPTSLKELDVFRSQTITQHLNERRKAKQSSQSQLLDGKPDTTGNKKISAKLKKKATSKTTTPQGAHLTKDELVKLVEWKLKHGTFRPTLLSLVSSNPDSTITSLTATVFSEYDSSSSSTTEGPDIPSLVSRLTALKGVGPATASLVLSALDPTRVPFFGDELFRWAMWDAAGTTGKAGFGAPNSRGWKRKIGYSAKEYTALVDIVEKARQRLSVGADEMEKVGFVLGREGVDIDEGIEDEGDDEKVDEDHDDENSNGKRKASMSDDEDDDKNRDMSKRRRKL